MKKTIIISGLLLVLFKMVYNMYSFINDVEYAKLEKLFHIALIFIVCSYIFFYGKKEGLSS